MREGKYECSVREEEKIAFWRGTPRKGGKRKFWICIQGENDRTKKGKWGVNYRSGEFGQQRFRAKIFESRRGRVPVFLFHSV